MNTHSVFLNRPAFTLNALLRSGKSPDLLIPIAVLILMSLIINWFDLDRQIANQFYMPDTGWVYKNDIWVQFFYKYGVWLAVGVAVAAFAVLIWSPFNRMLRRFRRIALFMLLLLLLGPGLIINVILKPHFGRPRPFQVVEYGGKKEFVPVLIPKFNERGFSFPSGHSSMGFYWIGLFVYWRKTSRHKSLICLATGIVHGSVIGAARMVQGAHWLSDVIWAAGFIYLTAWLLCRINWFQPKAGFTREKG